MPPGSFLLSHQPVSHCHLALGVVIPVHHDTGHWVKYTHRIHVPIITGPELEFLVGPNEQSMLSYDVSEGRIIELNNQAKHAVTNNLSYHRVHLIFDYVEDFPITRYTLQVRYPLPSSLPPPQPLCSLVRSFTKQEDPLISIPMIQNVIHLFSQINKLMNHFHPLLFLVSPPSFPSLSLSSSDGLHQVLRSVEPHLSTNTSVSTRLS
jgi:hypothetical protein